MKKLAPIISILSVLVMILWGVLVPNGWSKSWLAVFVGGARFDLRDLFRR